MIFGGMMKKMNKIKVFTTLLYLFILLSFFSDNAFSIQKGIVINAEIQYNYAQKCFKEKDYTTAIFEFKRFIYFFKDHEYVLNAEFQIGQAFYNLKEYKKAVIALNKIILPEDTEVFIPVKSYLIESYFIKSKALMFLGKFNASEVCMQNLLMITDDKTVHDRAYSFLALLYLKIAETNPDALQRAGKYIEKLSVENIDQPQKDKLQKVLVDMNSLKTKNPTIAGFASIIPGAGYLYCERYKDGIISFLFNTALMIAAHKAFDDGKDISHVLDYSRSRKANEEPKRVNVDFPLWMVKRLDEEASRVGVTRQSIIKVWIAERLEQAGSS